MDSGSGQDFRRAAAALAQGLQFIAHIQTIGVPFHLALAPDNGVKPGELSEIITYLAFYSGRAKAKAMSTWKEQDIRDIAETDDLHVAPFRDDGMTYGTPTWIWSVVLDDDLYVRAYNGPSSTWYQAALRQKAGRITAAGITLQPMTSLRGRSASVKICPR